MPVVLAVANGPISLLALAAHAHKHFYASYIGDSIVQKLNNKQSAKVICRFNRLRIAHS